ncbi:MAG: hypothetical protein ACK4YP_05410 [Myxococcota bacterium]
MLLLLLGCATGPGAGFGEIATAELSAAFAPGEARDLGGGEVLTQDGYAVRVDRFVLTFDDLALLALSGGASGEAFDPADPPEGYTLCHNGECHREDGAIVPYAEVEAELAGGEATLAPVVTLPVDADADLLTGATFPLDTSAAALLPAANLSSLQLGVTHLVLEGAVRRQPDDGWTAPLGLDLAVDAALSAPLVLPLDRDHDPVLALDVAVAPDGSLFDGIDFAALVEETAAEPDHDHLGEALTAALLAVEPVVTVERSR